LTRRRRERGAQNLVVRQAGFKVSRGAWGERVTRGLGKGERIIIV
jgi:hypothetical protein